MVSRSYRWTHYLQKTVVCMVQQFYYQREIKNWKWKRANCQQPIPKNTSVRSKFIIEYAWMKLEILKGVFRLPLNILEKDFAFRSSYANCTHPIPWAMCSSCRHMQVLTSYSTSWHSDFTNGRISLLILKMWTFFINIQNKNI